MNELKHFGDDGQSPGDVARIGAALEASITPNTATTYRTALHRLEAWLEGRPAVDATVAAYAALRNQGMAPATITQPVVRAAQETAFRISRHRYGLELLYGAA